MVWTEPVLYAWPAAPQLPSLPEWEWPWMGSCPLTEVLAARRLLWGGSRSEQKAASLVPVILTNEILVLVLRITVHGLKGLCWDIEFPGFLFLTCEKKFSSHQTSGQTNKNSAFLEVIYKLSLPLCGLPCGRN